jgi:hypothetical protein
LKIENGNNFYSYLSAPFKVEVKIGIPTFDGQVNVEVLSSWLKQMEVYFGLYQIQEAQQIYFSHMKMSKHALQWWESYVDAPRIGKMNMITKWEDFKALLKSQFYPIRY